MRRAHSFPFGELALVVGTGGLPQPTEAALRRIRSVGRLSLGIRHHCRHLVQAGNGNSIPTFMFRTVHRLVGAVEYRLNAVVLAEGCESNTDRAMDLLPIARPRSSFNFCPHLLRNPGGR